MKMVLVGYRKGDYKTKDGRHIDMMYVYWLSTDKDTVGQRPTTDRVFPDVFDYLSDEVNGIQDCIGKQYDVVYGRNGQIESLTLAIE